MPKKRDERTDERTQERRPPEDEAPERRSQGEDEGLPAQIGEDPGTLEPDAY